MGSLTSMLLAAVLAAADPPAGPGAASAPEEPRSIEEEAKSGAGVSPVELIPRLELRQSFVRLSSGATSHLTTTEIDIQFLDRLLLRYEGTLQTVSGPTGEVSGFGDTEIDAIAMLGANPRFVAVLIAGAILDTASQPQLGAGKKQLVLGAGAAIKPLRFWLAYVLVQEQASVAGASTRPDVNQLVARVGNIVFGPGFAWLKLDLDTVVDFAADQGRLFGKLEAGRLLVGRIGDVHARRHPAAGHAPGRLLAGGGRALPVPSRSLIAGAYHSLRDDVLERSRPAAEAGSTTHETEDAMYTSPSHLSETARADIADALNARLADGLDLHSQIKVAHWNIKGPQFAALHPLFETFAVSLANHNDSVAERAVTLGAKAFGTVRHVAKVSTLPEYPRDATRDLEHVKLLAERIEKYLDGTRAARGVGEKLGDTDTVDLLTGIITEFEKHAWFLRASLE